MKHFCFSSYANAWSIKQGLKKLGLDLLVNTSEYTFIKPDPSVSPGKGDCLFFTEEDSFLKYDKSDDGYFYFPQKMERSLIDDKISFSACLKSIGELPVPEYKYDEIPSFPVFLKARHSWKNGKNLPKGFLCNSEDDIEAAIEKVKKNGFEKEDYFVQKLLDGDVDNNISVSGFYDHTDQKNNLFIVTAKICLDHENRFSTGILVRSVNDTGGLVKRTENILRSLQYKGPFELEFFYDQKEEVFYVLELNARFWLQHGIFIKFYNNAIIRKYLGIKDPYYEEEEKTGKKKILWVDTSALIALFPRKKFFTASIVILKYFFRGYSFYWAPNFLTFIRYFFRIKFKRK
jgi:hypothetical protein